MDRESVDRDVAGTYVPPDEMDPEERRRAYVRVSLGVKHICTYRLAGGVGFYRNPRVRPTKSSFCGRCGPAEIVLRHHVCCSAKPIGQEHKPARTRNDGCILPHLISSAATHTFLFLLWPARLATCWRCPLPRPTLSSTHGDDIHEHLAAG
jgi:hypothetical protein